MDKFWMVSAGEPDLSLPGNCSFALFYSMPEPCRAAGVHREEDGRATNGFLEGRMRGKAIALLTRRRAVREKRDRLNGCGGAGRCAIGAATVFPQYLIDIPKALRRDGALLSKKRFGGIVL